MPHHFPLSAIALADPQFGSVCLISHQVDATFGDVHITPLGPTPPVAGFTGTPTSGVVPLVVQFTDQSTNGPTSWQWPTR